MFKKRLQTSLLMYDVITLFSIAVLVFVLFEVTIKPGMIEQNLEKFYENMNITNFDYENAMKFLEEKQILPYKENAIDVFNYIVKSTKERLKYNHSIVAVVFPDEINLFFAGEKGREDNVFNKDDFDYEFFAKNIESKKRYITFNLRNKKYIGVALKSDMGTYKTFDRKGDLVYPVFIIADRKDEFDYTTDIKKIVFIIWLSLIVIVAGGLKFIKIRKVIAETSGKV